MIYGCFPYRHLGGYSNERAELHARRVESARELKSLELAVSQMEQDISRLRTDIGTLGNGGIQ